MKEGTKLETAHRKALTDQLSGYSGTLYARVRDKYRTTRSAFENSVCARIAREMGADKLVAEISGLKAKLEVAELKLRDSGFEIDSSGNYDITRHAPESLRKSSTDEVEKAFGSESDVLDPLFETARLKLLLATTVEDAEKIVEPLLSFEVKVR